MVGNYRKGIRRKDSGLTPHEYKRALKALKDLDLVEAEYGKNPLKTRFGTVYAHTNQV